MTDLTPRVLLVDDEPFNIDILREYLENAGYFLDTAIDGDEAWTKLKTRPEHYDIVVLDRMMPGLSGMEVLDRIKQHTVLRSVPVIMQTAMVAQNEILEGLQAGAHYYLTKPFDQDMLLSVMATAAEDRMRYRRVQQAIAATGHALCLMRTASFRFKTIGEARDLASMLASACPDPNRTVVGLAELLLNAVEHGNLAIDYETKGRLREENRWEEEIEARLADPAYADREVEIDFTREPELIRILIKDQGDGFDWHQYLEIDPARALHAHGRGIAMSRLVSFDSVEFLGRGNQVEVTVKLTTD